METMGYGFRFYPSHKELIEYYLYNRVMEKPLPYVGVVRDFDLYSNEPKNIFETTTERILYFFTKVKKKTAKRFDRTVIIDKNHITGTWKGQTAGTKIKSGKGKVIGCMKNLVYKPRGPSEPFKYLMKEYSLEEGISLSAKVKDIVLCRIKKKENKVEEIGYNNIYVEVMENSEEVGLLEQDDYGLCNFSRMLEESLTAIEEDDNVLQQDANILSQENATESGQIRDMVPRETSSTLMDTTAAITVLGLETDTHEADIRSGDTFDQSYRRDGPNELDIFAQSKRVCQYEYVDGFICNDWGKGFGEILKEIQQETSSEENQSESLLLPETSCPSIDFWDDWSYYY